MKNQPFLRRVLFSLQGIRAAWLSENSFKAQVTITSLVLISLIFLKPDLLWAAIFTLVVGATLAAELFNTALEYMIDIVHPEFHQQIGRAKDCAAAAVLILSFSSILIYVLFLINKFA